ncbi:DegT/DnrJ/EryC1/StrS family aminotransferase [Thiorhodospira sibirica]|uniref:DegT/DnrJ/EryC1/StrS family aminotransferase n=1 Tax=Thiorhodospira sibirica TaxID=154347 RepID=UPI00022C0AE4|nr:DegT/DnrJ/EryC1/StrS family aminotransferase [Thiorhodospira sibirica]
MNPIPMVDLQRQYAALQAQIDGALAQVLASTQFILGPNVSALEEELAAYLGTPHAISCASGTDALHLALKAAQIGPGDEVITTPFTFIATAEAIHYCGAKAVFVDIDPHSFNLDPALVEAAITPRTKAILPVHLFGQPADMASLVALCQQHNLLLIEDCAQSFGARVDGQQTGTFGEFGCFSFFPSKNLGCYGDGGLVITEDPVAAKRLRGLRNHGSQVRYHHDEIGYNSRLDEIQAAILRIKLKDIDATNAQRRAVAQGYKQRLATLPLVLPHEDGLGTHVYHQYTVQCEATQRDHLIQQLGAAQIASAIYYPIPLHRQKVFAQEYQSIQLPVSERLATRCLSLPMYPELDDDQLDRIAECLTRALA